MPKFSATSLFRLKTCHLDIQRVCSHLINYYDFSVLHGHRDQHDQDHAYEMGYSTVKWPNSKHNKWPSMAVDLAPWPIDWQDTERFYLLAGRVLQVADEMGVTLRWGGDWDMDDDLHDQSFFDLGHYELIGWGYDDMLFADGDKFWEEMRERVA